MKLIIDIPDELKTEVHNHGLFLCPNDKTALVNAIKHGTPLPKGHGRLIDADEIQFENNEFDTYSDYSRAFDAIDGADTIIEADKTERSEE